LLSELEQLNGTDAGKSVCEQMHFRGPVFNSIADVRRRLRGVFMSLRRAASLPRVSPVQKNSMQPPSSHSLTDMYWQPAGAPLTPRPTVSVYFTPRASPRSTSTIAPLVFTVSAPPTVSDKALLLCDRDMTRTAATPPAGAVCV
jgi:hypothetical protein